MSSDYQLEDTLYLPFTTRAFATGIPTALVSGAVDIYEDVTATPIVTTETLTVSLNSVAGFNMITVTATAGTGFEAGKSYTAILQAGTVDSVSVVGEVVAHFTLDKSTAKTGYALSSTGADLILKSSTFALAMADAIWDEVLTGAEHNVATSAGRRLRFLQDSAGYEGGMIWIDTVNGTAGTSDFENGTVNNPVNTIADANTLGASLKIPNFHIANASSITFAASQANNSFFGENWTLALGGQNVAGLHLHGATVTGIMSGTGTTQIFMHCLMGATSLIKGTHILESAITGTLTMVEAGDIFIDRSHSGVAGTGTPSFSFGAAIGNSNLSVRNYSGGIQLEAMGDTGTDTASIEGNGQVIEGTCTGGTVAIRGNFTVSGITNLTLSDDARFDVDQINAEADLALSDYAPATVAALATAQADLDTITGTAGVELATGQTAAWASALEASASSIKEGAAKAGTLTTGTMSTTLTEADDVFNGRILIFKSDTATAALRLQATDITDFANVNGVLTFTAVTVAPGATDTFLIV